MNFDAFSHGQIISKLWLCEKLEPHVPENSVVFILGSWYNTLGSMMLTRNRNLYQHILGIDIDAQSIELADKLSSTWIIEKKLRNIVGDACSYKLEGPDVVINCSSEHMDSTWFNHVTNGTLVCIQSSDIVEPDEVWVIENPSSTLESFSEKYPMTETLFEGIYPIEYENGFRYKRFMKIGRK
jgi:hypothetical protein